MSKTVVGVFKSRNQAEKAVDELQNQGIDKNEISIVSKDDSKSRQGGQGGQGGHGIQSRSGSSDMEVAGEDVSSGVAWGGGLGAAAGLLAGAGALAIPGVGPILAAGPLAAALTGAVTGGLAGGLVDYGIPESRGKEYEKKVKEGDILTLIKCSGDESRKVEDVLRHNGASDVESHDAKH